MVATNGVVQDDPKVQVALANLDQEYVVSGYLGWYASAIRSLPWAIDDLTGEIGDDVYERMMRDPQIIACLAIWKASIIEDGASLMPAVTDSMDPDVDMAKAICGAATEMLDNLDTPLDAALWNLMDAAALGNKIAELIWRVDETPDGTRLNLRAIKCKPRRMTAFVVDRYNNVVGITAARKNEPMLWAAGGRIYNPPKEDILPREKFAILTFRPIDDDPRGTSILRAAYDPWFRKRQVLIEYVKYLSQFAGPSLIGKTPPDADDLPATDALGNPDPNGTPIKAEAALAKTLAAFRNAVAIALPFGTEVTPIQSSGEGRAFLNALQHCDQQIVISILTQTLATMESEHQARAAAQVHEDVLETLIRQAKKALVRVIERDILRNWMLYNWGPGLAYLTPKVTLGSTEKRQQPAVMAAIAQLVAAGYIQEDQLAAIDLLLGLPQRDTSQQAPFIIATQPPPAPLVPEPTPIEQGAGTGGATGGKSGATGAPGEGASNAA